MVRRLALLLLAIGSLLMAETNIHGPEAWTRGTFNVTTPDAGDANYPETIYREDVKTVDGAGPNGERIITSDDPAGSAHTIGGANFPTLGDDPAHVSMWNGGNGVYMEVDVQHAIAFFNETCWGYPFTIGQRNHLDEYFYVFILEVDLCNEEYNVTESGFGMGSFGTALPDDEWYTYRAFLKASSDNGSTGDGIVRIWRKPSLDDDSSFTLIYENTASFLKTSHTGDFVGMPPFGLNFVDHGRYGLLPTTNFRIFTLTEDEESPRLINNAEPCCADSGSGGAGAVLEPDERAPLPEWETSCDGGGTVPTAADVVNSEDWREIGIQSPPDVWAEVVTKAYPADTTATTRRSTKAMAYPTLIPGKMLRLPTIDRALSDWRGNLAATVLEWDELDTDGETRAMIAQLGTSAYAHPEVSLKLLSETGRKTGLTPRVIHRGFLVEAVPAPNRKARLTSVGALGSTFWKLDPAAPLQKVLITREWTERAGLTNTPKDRIGKPLNIIINEHSDKGAVDLNGDDAAKGMIPVDELGAKVYTSTQTVPTTDTFVVTIPPPVLTAEVVGDTGDETYHYFVSAITATGETVASAVATVTNAIPYESFDASNYVALSWAPPAGWEDVYAEHVIDYRVMGRSSSTPKYWLDGADPTRTSADGPPETTYNDGTRSGHIDIDREKSPAAPAVGTAKIVTTEPGDPATVTTHEEWVFFAWSLGFTPLLELRGSDGADTPKRTLLDPDDPDLMTPESANWPHADPWVELDGVTVSGFYAKGVRVQHHREKIVTFVVNCCGVTSTGDNLGTPITEAARGLQWLLNEIVLKNGGQGYRTGAFGPLETFTDGTPILKTSSFEAVQDATVAFIGGRGYQIHLAITELTTLGQVAQWVLETFGFLMGETQHGQVMLALLNELADTSGASVYRHKIEIPGRLPEPDQAEEEVENRIAYRYDWNPDTQEFRGDLQIIQDPPSQSMYGVRDAAPDFLGLRATRDRATANDSMRRRLYHNAIAPLYQPIPTHFRAIEEELGSIVTVTHPDGLNASGYVDHLFMVIRHRTLLGAPHKPVTLVARDLSRVMTPSAFWTGSEDYVVWPEMGSEAEPDWPEMGSELDWS